VVVTQPIIFSGRTAVLAVLSVVIVACSPVGSDDAITTSSSTTTTATATATSGPVTEPTVEDDLLSEQLAGITVLEGRGAAMVALVEANGEVYYASKGSDSTGSSLSADAVFRVGSITKMFTAALVLTLVEEGAVDLDAPAADYVTRVNMPEGVTVRDLLQHTSGVPNYTDGPTDPLGSFDEPERAWSPEEIVALVSDRAPRFEPGARFSYSNTNYTILGVLVEEVTGMPFGEVLRARILDPLELDATYLAGFEEGQEPFGAYYATGAVTEPIDFPYTSIATSAWAAGALVSSVEDLHTFLTALFDEHVISAELLAAMTANEEYGLGIFRFPGFGSLYGHSGGIPGYITLVLHAPDTGKTAFWVATTNTTIFDPPIDELIAHLDS
jgi:D-alanyl-D-alanine carboxypeptidase